MAVLASTTDGNLTSSSTWSLVDATSYLSLASQTNVAQISTGYINTTAFTPGAIVVSAIGLALTRRAGTTGTLSYQLYNLTDSIAVTGTTVTINISDLPSASSVNSTGIGWTFLKLASPVTLVAGKSYCVRFLTSSASQVSYYYTTTSNNPIRALVTTTNQAPAAGDTLLVAGSYTGAGTSTTAAVTMNDTSGTTYGSILISAKGSLTYGTASSTNYRLVTNSSITIGKGGTFSIGSTGSPFPATSTATIEVGGSNAITVDGGVFAVYGDTGRIPTAKLVADVALGATASTISSSSSGWKNGDFIAVPSTTRTAADAEVITLSADASGATLSHSAYAAAHGGNATTLVQATVCNLTRNVKIFATVLSAPTYITVIGDDPTLILYNVQMFGIGGASAAVNSAITMNANLATAGTIDVQYCSIYQNPSSLGINAVYVASNANFTLFNFKYNVVYGMSFAFSNSVIYSGANFTSPPTISYNCFIKNISSGQVVIIQDPRYNFNNNEINSSTNASVYPLLLQLTLTQGTAYTIGNWDNNSVYSNAGVAGVVFSFYNNASVPITMSGWRVWRNNAPGIAFQVTNASAGLVYTTSSNLSAPVTLDSWYMFGNLTANINFGMSTGPLVFSNGYFWGGTTLTSNSCMVASTSPFTTGSNAVKFISCTYGRDHLGNTSNFTTSILPASGFWALNYVSMYNCTFSGTETSGAGRGVIEGPIGIISLKHNGATGSHKAFAQNSIISTDTTIYNVGTSSLRITPNSTAFRAFTPLVRVPVKSGNTCTISVDVRKSAAGDGAAYSGNQPRLMYHANYLAGNTSETVGATVGATAGTWVTLTYTTPAVADDSVLEFYVDCDGTVGWVNVNNWASTTNNSSRGTGFWTSLNNGTYVEVDNPGAVTSSSTFVT